MTSYVTVLDGRKEYKRGSIVGLDVDPEEYSIIEMERDMSAYYEWGSYRFWYNKNG